MGKRKRESKKSREHSRHRLSEKENSPYSPTEDAKQVDLDVKRMGKRKPEKQRHLAEKESSSSRTEDAEELKWIVETDPTTLVELIPDEFSFKSFKQNFLSSANGPPIATDAARTFLWHLVQKLQELHVLGICPKKIRSKYIYVSPRNEARLFAKTVPYSPEMAKENYKSLHEFILKYFLVGYEQEERRPFMVNRFLQLLLSEKVLEYAPLIARHYCIMSDRSRISFANALVLCPSTMSHEERSEFYVFLDSVPIDGSWKHSGITSHPYLNETFAKKQYEPDCPLTKNFWLVLFERECHNHIRKDNTRTRFLPTPIGLRVWKNKVAIEEGCTTQEVMKRYNRLFDKNNDDPRHTNREILEQLIQNFPEFLTRVQERLFTGQLIEVLGIDPRDKFPR